MPRELDLFMNNCDWSSKELKCSPLEIARLHRASEETRLEGHRAVAKLKDCQGEVAGLLISLGMLSKELWMKVSELMDDVGRMEDLHNWMVSEHIFFRGH